MRILDVGAGHGCVLSICCTGVGSTGIVLLKCSSDSVISWEAALFNANDKRLPVEMRAPTRFSEIH